MRSMALAIALRAACSWLTRGESADLQRRLSLLAFWLRIIQTALARRRSVGKAAIPAIPDRPILVLNIILAAVLNDQLRNKMVQHVGYWLLPAFNLILYSISENL
jgi:hypothetical protein